MLSHTGFSTKGKRPNERAKHASLVPRCFRWVPFLFLRRERAGIRRLLRFPQMFFWVPLRCQRAIWEICGSSPKAAKVSQSARGALAPGGSGESEPGGCEALRAPPAPSNESEGHGVAGEPGHAHSGAVLRPSRGGPLFLARPVAALAGLACRPASYRRARRARQAGLGGQGRFFRKRGPVAARIECAARRHRGNPPSPFSWKQGAPRVRFLGLF